MGDLADWPAAAAAGLVASRAADWPGTGSWSAVGQAALSQRLLGCLGTAGCSAFESVPAAAAAAAGLPASGRCLLAWQPREQQDECPACWVAASPGAASKAGGQPAGVCLAPRVAEQAAWLSARLCQGLGVRLQAPLRPCCVLQRRCESDPPGIACAPASGSQPVRWLEPVLLHSRMERAGILAGWLVRPAQRVCRGRV